MSAQKASLAIALLFCSTAHGELIHRWSFDEVAGTTVVDSVGGANGAMINMDGTERSNDTPIGTGKSLTFDASLKQYVELGSNFVTLESDSDFSVAFWYKGTQISQLADWGAFGLLSWDSNGIVASVSLQDGKLLYSHYDGAWQTNITSTSSIANGDWNHIALVNYSNETADLYINGVKEIDGEASDITTNFRIQQFMQGHASTPEYVSGSLDELRVYDHALTAGEISSLQAVPEPSTLLGGALLIGVIGVTRYRSVADKRGENCRDRSESA